MADAFRELTHRLDRLSRKQACTMLPRRVVVEASGIQRELRKCGPSHNGKSINTRRWARGLASYDDAAWDRAISEESSIENSLRKKSTVAVWRNLHTMF